MQTCDIDINAEVEKISQSAPYIFVLGKPGTESVQYFICGEKEVMFEAKTMLDSILDLIGAYYIFDVVYPKSLSGIFLFFQQQVFGIKDEQVTPPCLAKVLKNISTLS